MLGWQLNMSTLDALSGAKLRIFLHIPKEFSQNLVLSLDLKAVRSFFFPSYHYHDRIYPLAESDFGKLWLGCFVKQLGGDEGKIRMMNCSRSSHVCMTKTNVY